MFLVAAIKQAQVPVIYSAQYVTPNPLWPSTWRLEKVWLT